MEIKNLNYHEDRWVDGNLTPEDLIQFEDDVIKHWEGGKIRGPIHLSNGTTSTIDSIEDLPMMDYQTYLITVADNHNFYANNILVHNK